MPVTMLLTDITDDTTLTLLLPMAGHFVNTLSFLSDSQLPYCFISDSWPPFSLPLLRH